MSMIDIDDIKHGLLPVQQAEARYKQASAASAAGSEAGADMAPLFAAVEQARTAYLDACVRLHGYVQGAVNIAEGRRADQDE
ncbi:hypothetical protein [Pseudomonas siliginis]|uniref:hypothetical protein n=1 Tax=Pseudomonas siliginis TaxID=2842346 RepID=UPI002093BA5F|nr:hypothetical protein [Pseudomonas siliginis]UST77215.1 hypothetical protein NF676_00095 [Pseudomonas siliginis]